MSEISIDSNLFLTNAANSTREVKNILGKDDFLKLLITQLKFQDPLNPMEDKEFISEMANFSALEQMTNLNKSFETFLSIVQNDSLLKYSELIGKTVEYTKNGQTVESIVKSVRLNDSEIAIELENGDEIDRLSISKVSDTGEQEPSQQE